MRRPQRGLRAQSTHFQYLSIGVLRVQRRRLFDLRKISAVAGSLNGIFISLQLSDVMPILVPAAPDYGKMLNNKPLGDRTKLHVKVGWSQPAVDYYPIAHPMNPSRSNLPRYPVFPNELPQLVTRQSGFTYLW